MQFVRNLINGLSQRLGVRDSVAGLDCPVLFLVFNRPELTQEVFNEIRRAKPKKLFIAADGPRQHVEGEKQRCQKVRNIVKQVDWDCQVQTRFLGQNQGCGKAVSGAINWFFENVEAGIILEDDCLPDPTFFEFCRQMLLTYADDSRIMSVSGDNFQGGQTHGDGSYYFSKLPHCWGWASWRRAWKQYDFNIATFPEYQRTNAVSTFHPDADIQAFMLNLFESMYKQSIDTWDIQFVYTVARSGGLCVLPNVNLVSNIGFGADATHTFETDAAMADLTRHGMESIVHPSGIQWSVEADTYTFKSVYKVKCATPQCV